MDSIVNRDYNPLWFIDESTELIEYSEGGLANQIFDLVESRILRDQKEIISSIVNASPAVAELAKGLKKTQRLKLVFSDEIREKVTNGTYHLMESADKDGIFKAVVVDSKGKIRGVADLEWEVVAQGVDMTALSSAMQGASVQEILHDIAEQLEDMSVSMGEVLMGQYNDRLALYYSGEAIYREALATKDPERRNQLATSAILSLTNAVTSLQTTLAYEITNICDKYDADKGKFIGIKTDKLKEKMFLINSSFQTIHKAVTLKAAIYYQQQEYAALTAVLSDYKSFLSRSLTDENAHILYLADPGEKNISGIWNIRQNELPQRIEKAREMLAAPAEYALEAKKEDLA